MLKRNARIIAMLAIVTTILGMSIASNTQVKAINLEGKKSLSKVNTVKVPNLDYDNIIIRTVPTTVNSILKTRNNIIYKIEEYKKFFRGAIDSKDFTKVPEKIVELEKLIGLAIKEGAPTNGGIRILNEVHDELEKVKPTTVKPVTEVKPTTVKPVIEVKPTTVKPVIEIKPTTVKPVTEIKPTTVKPVTEVKPTTVKPVIEVKPTTVKPVTEIKPTTVKPVTEVKPTTVKPVIEVKPTTVKPVTEVKPTTVKPVTEVKPTTVKPVIEVKPTTVKPVTEIKPTTVKPVTEIKPTTVKPVTEIKPTTVKNDANHKKEIKLVKTGSNVDANLLMQIGTALSIVGAFLIKKFKK